ncbi:MAG: hypothetical protein L6R28_12665 [Planctomycetes bacterium]|nr:hypothetical protein [Planctomycetota bacterium]
MRTIIALVALSLLLVCAALRAGEPEKEKIPPPPPKVDAPAGECAVPENKWFKIAEVPADPLGRELEPGRGAFWCFEPQSKAFLRYGGYTPTDDNALWTFDLAQRKWANPLKSNYAWPPPEDRPGAGAWWSAAYDAKRKVVWFACGSGVAARTHAALFDDLWQYDPAKGTFTAMKSKGFPKLSATTRIVYDAKNDLVVRAPAYDGEWAAMHNRDQTWVYSPEKNVWEARKTPGGPKNALSAAFVYEPDAGVCVYVKPGGADGPAETWTFDAAAGAWKKLESKENPPGAAAPGACYDPVAKAVVLYGGVGGVKGAYGYLFRGGGVQLHETWALDAAKGQWRKLDVGAPAIPKLHGEGGRRFELVCAMDYDSARQAIVLAAPTMGVWALRLRPEGAAALPELKCAALPAAEKIEAPKDPVFPPAEPNKKLLEIKPNTWVKLGGGGRLGGGEVPWTYDEATGFVLKYGGCNNGGTTFASGYGNDLCAYDPATERWIALRWVDPCGPPRPANGCTRSYTYDPEHKVTWFQGGTSGNQLAYSLPPGWDGSGTWIYDGLKDRFELRKTTGRGAGVGVVNCYDRANKRVVVVSKQAWQVPNVTVLDPAACAWADQAPVRAMQYTYACYVDTLKAMFVIESDKDSAKTLAYDAAAGAWKDLAPKGEAPTGVGRPATAYDPETDAVLLAGEGKTLIYTVKENAWKLLAADPPAPKIAECVVYDTRHKVFLALADAVYAFKYKP